jgi:LmbE family N-acetylglucosaminyl deacetylase
MSHVLVISPHPDDEAIGCGGTLRRHAGAGDDVRVVFLTSGEHGCRGRPPEETARLREREAASAAAVLGVAVIDFWRQPDGACRATRPLTERLRTVLTAFQPEVIYVPHEGEAHPDHRAAVRLVRAARSALPPRVTRPDVFMFEVWTPLQVLDHIEDISAHVDVKRAAIRAHASQCAIMKFDEAALALNRYRGEMHSWPGGDYAEVFRRLP